MKAILGVGLCFGVGQLPEAGLFQAMVASEDLALWADNRPGGYGGEFVLSIWFVKCPKRHIQTAQPIKAVKKLAFIGNAKHDKVRMRTIGWKKRFADFKNGMARLNDLLGERQVGPDEDVKISRGVALREFHGWLLRRKLKLTQLYPPLPAK